MKIALDAMGGDYAPKNIIAGAVLALREYPQITKLFLVGDTARIEAELKSNHFSDPRIEIIHTTQIVDMNDSGLDAVRRKKDSSISRAVELVKTGSADAVVSAGHTGAAVTASLIKLRTLPGIDRPAIASIMPTEKNRFVLIDAGANPDPKPENLVENAIMGAAYSRHVLGYKNPSIGLMSIGTEEGKGDDFTTKVFDLLKKSGLNFRGNVEGHDLFENPVEVVVCDGFTGNVVLKTSEAIAHAIFGWVKNEVMKGGLLAQLGGLLVKPALQVIKKKTSSDEVGGSQLLGVNGITIIAHGGSSPSAIKNAIRTAMESITHHVNPHIVEEIKRYNEASTATQPTPA
ncbi:MAG: phosphate acyltransferase PlsX [Chthoniobacteraceae bacterium]